MIKDTQVSDEESKISPELTIFSDHKFIFKDVNSRTPEKLFISKTNKQLWAQTLVHRGALEFHLCVLNSSVVVSEMKQRKTPHLDNI